VRASPLRVGWGAGRRPNCPRVRTQCPPSAVGMVPVRVVLVLRCAPGRAGGVAGLRGGPRVVRPAVVGTGALAGSWTGVVCLGGGEVPWLVPGVSTRCPT